MVPPRPILHRCCALALDQPRPPIYGLPGGHTMYRQVRTYFYDVLLVLART